jgi:hypothetical protein
MELIRKIYLYLFSLVGLVLVVIGCVQLVNLGLRTFVFPDADKYYAYPMPAPVSSPDGSAPTTTVAAPTDAQLQAYQDQQTRSQHESTAAEAVAMIVVGMPLYLYHWRVIRKDKAD